MNKRGSLIDITFIAIMLAALAIIVFPVVDSVIQINNDIQNLSDIDPQSKAISQDLTNRLPLIFEGIYLMLLIIGYVGTFILANQVKVQMPFFIIAAIFFTAMLVVLPILANAWDGITDGSFSQATSQFVIIPFVMQHYLKLGLLAWFLVGFGLYAKRVTRS